MKNSTFLKISLHGMDYHEQKTMSNYIKQISKDTTHIVHESVSQVEIIDIDLAPSKQLLKSRLSQQPSKPIIVLSLNKVSLDNVIYVKKPLSISDFLKAIKTAQTKISKKQSNQTVQKNNNTEQAKRVISNNIQPADDKLSSISAKKPSIVEPIKTTQDDRRLSKPSIPTKKEKLVNKSSYTVRHVDSVSATKPDSHPPIINNPKTINATLTEKSTASVQKKVPQNTINDSLNNDPALKQEKPANNTVPSSVTNQSEHNKNIHSSSLKASSATPQNKDKIPTHPRKTIKKNMSSKKKQILANLVNEAIRKASSEKPEKPSINHLSINTIKTIQHDNGSLTISVNLNKQKDSTKKTNPEHSISTKKQRTSIKHASLSKKDRIKVNHNSKKTIPKSPALEMDEIDKLLQELNIFSKKTASPEKKRRISSQQNRRKTIRYFSEPIEAKLKKKSLTHFNKKLAVQILNISSKGALIKLQKPSKLGGKISLTVQFPFHHDFTISARIVRNISTSTYGLQFLKYHNGLTDFLVKSGRSSIHM